LIFGAVVAAGLSMAEARERTLTLTISLKTTGHSIVFDQTERKVTANYMEVNDKTKDFYAEGSELQMLFTPKAASNPRISSDAPCCVPTFISTLRGACSPGSSSSVWDATVSPATLIKLRRSIL